MLVSLERAFEGYATRLFSEAFGGGVRAQQGVSLGSPRGGDERGPNPLPSGSRQTIELTPDLTVYRHSAPVSVWDAKWKRPDPAADDVHQALAYAAVLGVPNCGLVYPGRRWRCETLRTPGGVALHLLRLPLTDDPARWQQVVRRVRRA